MSYILDASTLVPLIMIYGKGLREILGNHEIHVLDLTCYEVCNAFWKEYIKLHRIPKELALDSCIYMVEFMIKHTFIHSLNELEVDTVFNIAVDNNITIYDASYIALAKKLGIPIVSNDHDLLDTAPKLGIKTYDLEKFLEILTET